ncbi:MAG: hypothetical protein WBW45_11445, partial [Bradyrhizobium sp.]
MARPFAGDAERPCLNLDITARGGRAVARRAGSANAQGAPLTVKAFSLIDWLRGLEMSRSEIEHESIVTQTLSASAASKPADHPYV